MQGIDFGGDASAHALSDTLSGKSEVLANFLKTADNAGFPDIQKITLRYRQTAKIDFDFQEQQLLCAPMILSDTVIDRIHFTLLLQSNRSASILCIWRDQLS